MRGVICDAIEEDPDFYKWFLVTAHPVVDEEGNLIEANWNRYLATMRTKDEWGTEIEIAAAANELRRNIYLFRHESPMWTSPCRTWNPTSPEAAAVAETRPPIRLSYHGKNHYNSIIVHDATDAK